MHAYMLPRFAPWQWGKPCITRPDAIFCVGWQLNTRIVVYILNNKLLYIFIDLLLLRISGYSVSKCYNFHAGNHNNSNNYNIHTDNNNNSNNNN